MDVPVDLSRVLFVCTANNLDTIPAPLLDRMEVLEVSGYVSEEKSVIAEKYLGPQAKEASGLKDADVLLEPSAVDVLIKYYCRESGVRNLKKHIDKVRRSNARVLPSSRLMMVVALDLPEGGPETDFGPGGISLPRTRKPVVDPEHERRGQDGRVSAARL
jgi:ATP-dependent Lon protease